MKKLICFVIALSGALCILTGQDATIWVPKVGGIPAIAIPDFRGSGDAQKFMAAFNETLSADVKACGRLRIVAKTSLPTFVPQQPADFQRPTPPDQSPARGRKKQSPPATVPTTRGGACTHGWWRRPAQGNQLASGY